ncbi:hypothetical protein KR054_010360 [Drosophila jambulina]|nr:hypothetical protein KR054_010360 [Drosophila jambulina]
MAEVPAGSPQEDFKQLRNQLNELERTIKREKEQMEKAEKKVLSYNADNENIEKVISEIQDQLKSEEQHLARLNGTKRNCSYSNDVLRIVKERVDKEAAELKSKIRAEYKGMYFDLQRKLLHPGHNF